MVARWLPLVTARYWCDAGRRVYERRSLEIPVGGRDKQNKNDYFQRAFRGCRVRQNKRVKRSFFPDNILFRAFFSFFSLPIFERLRDTISTGTRRGGASVQYNTNNKVLKFIRVFRGPAAVSGRYITVVVDEDLRSFYYIVRVGFTRTWPITGTDRKTTREIGTNNKILRLTAVGFFYRRRRPIEPRPRPKRTFKVISAVGRRSRDTEIHLDPFIALLLVKENIPSAFVIVL